MRQLTFGGALAPVAAVLVVPSHAPAATHNATLTGADGRYEFSSIRPASYPDSTIPQHVHMTLTSKIRREDSVDSIMFADDKFVTAETRRELTGRGGFDPILKMEKGANGIWRGVRDIMI